MADLLAIRLGVFDCYDRTLLLVAQQAGFRALTERLSARSSFSLQRTNTPRTPTKDRGPDVVGECPLTGLGWAG
ncbi:MAG TPA: hypothetical protein VMG12_25665 [Polyangiaceae bacterium]|nr:hypothetical protein [Polyangiaceae bacterium]